MKRKKKSFHKSSFFFTKIRKKKTSTKSPAASILGMKRKKRRCHKFSQQQQQSLSESDFYLPDECWAHVFTLVITHNRDFKYLSLVSKQFLSITNRLLFSIRIFDRQFCFLSSIFRRFSNLNSLDLWFNSHDLDAGIASALRDRRTLKSLSISRIELKDANYVTSQLIDSLVSLKGLNCLKFCFSQISDDLLYSVARECLPLKTLVLKYCIGYSYDGIYDLLSNCPGIQHLNLQANHSLNNHHVVQLSLLLPSLVSITLSRCSQLTELALFAFIRNCHSLCEITMEHIYRRRESEENSYSLKDFHVNPQLKFLRLAHNLFIDDESIILFASIFPNLHHLDLSYCNHISKKSICQVLSRCCKVRHLNFTNCNEVKRIKTNLVVHHLEVLNLSGTSVSDKTIYEISKSCRGLLQLLLARCNSVTIKGVISVVENCIQLKEIDLRGCKKVDACVVSKVLLRYSLQKRNPITRYGRLVFYSSFNSKM